MFKILGYTSIIALLCFTACAPAAGGASADSAKIGSMVQAKVDSLTKELAADCDRRIASAVKSKVNAQNAAAAAAAARARTQSSSASSGSSASSLPTNIKPEKKLGKLGGKLGNGGKVISGTGEKVRQTVNKNFDPAKKKKGKLSGKLKGKN